MKGYNKMPVPSESIEQTYLFRWALREEEAYPELELMYHIPNGGFRKKSTAKRLKREGVKAGVPDVCLPVPRGIYHGLYVEMKVGDNTTTEKQDKWLEKLKIQGYFTCSCYGHEEASEVITKYLNKRSGEA